MKNKNNIVQIIKSIIAIIILVWAFPKNNIIGKIIISPFLICAISIFLEYTFLLFNKEKISNIFKYVFRITFFIYFLGVLGYAFYYSIVNKSYSLIIVIIIFSFFAINYFKGVFFKKK